MVSNTLKIITHGLHAISRLSCWMNEKYAHMQSFLLSLLFRFSFNPTHRLISCQHLEIMNLHHGIVYHFLGLHGVFSSSCQYVLSILTVKGRGVSIYSHINDSFGPRQLHKPHFTYYMGLKSFQYTVEPI